MSTATTTKIISHGDVITWSIQVSSNVPCGAKSSSGVVYFAVAGARPLTATRTDAATWGGSSDRYVSSYSLESCCPISWKIGWSSAGVADSTYLPPVRFARLCSVSGSYWGELRPTEMTRTLASAATGRVKIFG